MGERTILTFTGDIGFDKHMQNKWLDKDLISDEILAVFEKSNHVIINLEGALISGGLSQGKRVEDSLLHTIEPEAICVLKKLNADIWNLANNHIMDVGEKGLKATIDEAKKFGAQTIGAGYNLKDAKKPVILREAGGIGLFGVGYQRGCKPAGESKGGCLSWSDLDSIQEVIDIIKRDCKWCIIVSHGGEEFTSLPSPYTRSRYLQFLEMGADIVVSHHPHVPMNYELVEDKAIYYSLGNFIFDTDYQRAQYNTEKGVVLQLIFSESSFEFKPVGIKINRDNEHVELGDIPSIFTNIQEEDYKQLSPLAAKMFIEATKRQQIFLHPEKFKNASENDWLEHLMDPMRSGRVPGETLDFHVIYPLSKEAEKGEWKRSRQKSVVQYILNQT